ncbi:MAG: phage coat protein [Xanthomonadales bacterium]|nr:phage coat protein [Xanthomonadales bacterium]
MDVSAIVTAIGDVGTAGASIGAAVLLGLVGIAVYKWVRRAL